MSESFVSANAPALSFEDSFVQALLLATWTNEWVLGECSADDFVEALNAHDISIATSPTSATDTQLLAWLSSNKMKPTMSTGPARAVFPVSGDAAGLTNPKAFIQQAVRVGGAVIFDEQQLALTLESPSGRWRQWSVELSHSAQNIVPPETAAIQMREALHQAVDLLAHTQIAAARSELVTTEVKALQATIDSLPMPASLSNSRRETIARAIFIIGVCHLATTEVSARTDTCIISELATNARRCLSAASWTR